MDGVSAAQKNRVCQDAQDGVEHGAKRAAASRPRKRRRVRAAREAQLPGQHDEAMDRREPRQGGRDGHIFNKLI